MLHYKEPSVDEKRCGNCRWWFVWFPRYEGTGIANCMAFPSNMCLSILTRAEAGCSIPEKFAPLPQNKEPAP